MTLALAWRCATATSLAPAALGLICPWADLALDIDQKRPVLRDPLILPSMCAEWAPQYAGVRGSAGCPASLPRVQT